MDNKIKDIYTHLLKVELVPAMGCTEPIALAYGVAYATKLLGKKPEKITVQCSGNIIKNTKSVTVPSTGGMRGIKAAALAGAIGGDADLRLEVLSTVTEQNIREIKKLVDTDMVTVEHLESPHLLHVISIVRAGEDYVSVEIVDEHTNIGKIIKNGEVLQEGNEADFLQEQEDREALNVRDILSYAEEVDLAEVRELLERQINYNTLIAEEGLRGNWGANVGRTILESSEDCIQTKMKAIAAAGSDARMNGCVMPVVTNSGSGNQGITVSLPVVKYAESIGASREKLFRALLVANLVAIHQRTGTGRLSAFCGALCAGTGAACGVAYLDDGGYEVIAQTIINSLGNVGGMVCDGAKSSCAAKIASSLECALLAYDLAKRGRGFRSGEGIIKDDVEKTIASVGRMAAKGMYGTDKEILKIMIDA